MRLNQTDLAILKMLRKGIQDVQICKKLGYHGDNVQQGIDRIREAITKNGGNRNLIHIDNSSGFAHNVTASK